MTGSAHEPDDHRMSLYGKKVLEPVVLGPDFEQRLTTQGRRLCLSVGKVTGV